MPRSIEIPQTIRGILPWIEPLPAWLVGGSVRDHFLQHPTHDYDLVVEGHAIPLGKKIANAIGGDFFVLDAKRGMCRVLSGKPGQTFTLDLASLRDPSIEADLYLRDFTMNALAINIYTGELLDPTGGLQDILDHRLRPCAKDSLQQDPIRILRAIRLAVSLKARWSEDVVSQIRDARPHLSNISHERIRDEFFCMLGLERPDAALRLLVYEEVAEQILPDLAYDSAAICQKALAVVQAARKLTQWLSPERGGHAGSLLEAEALTRLGLYRQSLQDHLRKTNPSGRNVKQLLVLAAFHAGAMPAGKSDAVVRAREQVLASGRRLSLSKVECQTLEKMIHLQQLIDSIHAEINYTAESGYHFFESAGSEGSEAILLFLARAMSRQVSMKLSDGVLQYLETAAFLLEVVIGKRNAYNGDPLLDGIDIQKILKIGPGPEVGEIMKRLHKAQALGEVASREDAKQYVRQLNHPDRE